VLGEAIDYSRQGQLAVRDAAFKPTIAIPTLPAAATVPAH